MQIRENVFFVIIIKEQFVMSCSFYTSSIISKKNYSIMIYKLMLSQFCIFCI